jgi:hypothetical protein
VFRYHRPVLNRRFLSIFATVLALREGQARPRAEPSPVRGRWRTPWRGGGSSVPAAIRPRPSSGPERAGGRAPSTGAAPSRAPGSLRTLVGAAAGELDVEVFEERSASISSVSIPGAPGTLRWACSNHCVQMSPSAPTAIPPCFLQRKHGLLILRGDPHQATENRQPGVTFRPEGKRTLEVSVADLGRRTQGPVGGDRRDFLGIVRSLGEPETAVGPTAMPPGLDSSFAVGNRANSPVGVIRPT